MKKGWDVKKISEIGKIYNGNSINKDVKKNKYTGIKDGLPYIATKDVSYESIIDYNNGIKIPFEDTSLFKIAPKNTVLICAEGGSAGRKIGFTNQDICFGNKLFAINTNKNVESRFVYYYYFSSTFQKHFSTELAGIIGGVSMNKFKDIEIPLPSSIEQKCIVAILDKAFAAIAKAKENAEKNLQNAKELFKSYSQAVLENKGKNWEIKKLGEIADYFIGLTYSPKDVSDNGIVVLRSSNIQNGKLDFSDIVRVNRPIKETLKVKNGDILMCSRNGSKRLVGKTATIQGLKEEMTFGTFMMIIRSKYNSYLSWFFISDEFREQIGVGENTMINQITKYMLDDISVPIPPLSEQQTIIQKFDILSAETKKLEAIYKQKLTDLEELKKSILQKAFNGELSGACL